MTGSKAFTRCRVDMVNRVSDHRFSPKDFALSTAKQLKFKIEIMQVQHKKGLIAFRNALSLSSQILLRDLLVNQRLEEGVL